MSDITKVHVEAALLTFGSSFLIALLSALASNNLDLAHLTGGAIVSILTTAAQAGLRAVNNKITYGNFAGKKL